MNDNIKKLLDIAQNEIGYVEKASKKDLEDKVKNAGNNNYTKYAEECFPELQGMAWCCMFVWWCFEKAFGKIMTHNLIGEKTAKCSVMHDNMLRMECIEVDSAEPGDIIFFNSGSGINHIGIVYSVGSTIATIEGNTSRGYNMVVPNGGGVFTRAYQKNNYRIDSIIRPRWDYLKSEPVSVYNAEINAINVNIRDGAGTQCNWVGQETKGFKLNIIGEKKDLNGRNWYVFMYKGKIAYICSEFVKRVTNYV